jgi:hypothetical protein
VSVRLEIIIMIFNLKFNFRVRLHSGCQWRQPECQCHCQWPGLARWTGAALARHSLAGLGWQANSESDSESDAEPATVALRLALAVAHLTLPTVLPPLASVASVYCEFDSVVSPVAS